MASTKQLSTNLGLDSLPTPADPKNFNDLLRIYNAINALAAQLDVYTGALQQDPTIWAQTSPEQTLWTAGANRLYLPTLDNLTAGSLATIVNSGGTYKAKLAGGPGWNGDCRGYSTGVYNAGDMAEIILFGLCTVVTGLVPGTTYYVSNGTAGAFTSSIPGTAGNRIQPIGYSIAPGSLFFNPSVLVLTV